jgi:hypothetical protein
MPTAGACLYQNHSATLNHPHKWQPWHKLTLKKHEAQGCVYGMNAAVAHFVVQKACQMSCQAWLDSCAVADELEGRHVSIIFQKSTLARRGQTK